MDTRCSSFAGKLLVLIFAGAGLCSAQNGGRNNPYSPSPGGRARVDQTSQAVGQTAKSDPNQAAFIIQSSATDNGGDHGNPTIARQAKKAEDFTRTASKPPTDIYRVGVGDVLYINLKNAVRASGYHTIRQDGTIDFPLAGEDLVVAGRVTEEIEQILASRITIYPDPQVEVKVREYGSHTITVSGLVDNGGEKKLQREAVPLYVIKAMSGVSPRATRVVITRAPLLKPESYELRDTASDDILICPGNGIEFTGDNTAALSVYFISGEVRSPGQKALVQGMTLYQAIAASGGSKGDPKKAVVRRKNDAGSFTVMSYDLRSIKDGKAADPVVNSGDVIEIRN
jgi:protein involved in polysaccharide export with SLBB domain